MKKFISLCLTVCIAFSLISIIPASAKGYLTIAEYNDNGGEFKAAALDQIMVNNEAQDLCKAGSAGDYLAKNKNVIEGVYDNIIFKGWVGFDQEIVKFGYCIGEGDAVLIDNTVIEPEGAVKSAGGEYAVRYRYPTDVSGITEKTRIIPVAQLQDGTIVEILRYNVSYDPTATGEKEVEEDFDITSGAQGAAMQFDNKDSVGFKINIPEGKKLGSFVVVNAPTWGSKDDSGLTAYIYDWKGSYEDTIENDPFASTTIEGHIDCASLMVSFGYVSAGDYLIVFTEFTNMIGGWTSEGGIIEGLEDKFAYFENEEEVIGVPGMRITYIDNSNPPAPTPVPTEKPTKAPTQAPTEIPVTQAPTEVPATSVPATEAPKDNTEATQKPAEQQNAETEKGGNTGLVIGIVAAVVVIAAVVAVVIVKKKKK